MGERLVRNEEVSGSNPLISTKSHAFRGVCAIREAGPSSRCRTIGQPQRGVKRIAICPPC